MTDYEKKQQEILEKESKASQIYNTSFEKGKEKTELALNWFQKYLTQVILTFVSFVMIGIQQFAEAQFDPYFFARADFWFEYIPFVSAQWIILFAVVTGNIKWLSEVETQYLREVELIQEHVDRDKTTPYISLGVKDADKARKINAHRINVSRKVQKVITKYEFGTYSQLELFVKKSDDCKVTVKSKLRFIFFFFKNKLNKSKEKKLRNKLDYLLQAFDDKWIDENIQNIKLKYVQVTESGLINGFSPRSNETYISDFKENLGGTMVDEFGLGQAVTMALGFIILALDLVAKSATVTTWAMFIFKMFILYWAYFKANSRSKPIFKKTTLKALQERRKELDNIERLYKEKRLS